MSARKRAPKWLVAGALAILRSDGDELEVIVRGSVEGDGMVPVDAPSPVTARGLVRLTVPLSRLRKRPKPGWWPHLK